MKKKKKTYKLPHKRIYCIERKTMAQYAKKIRQLTKKIQQNRN